MSERSERYAEYLQTEHWANLREQKFSESGKRCENCKSSLRIHVHHINYKNLYDVLTSDLIVFCEECHNAAHRYSKFKNISIEGKPLEFLKDFISEYKNTNEYKRSKLRALNRQLRKEKRKGKWSRSFEFKKAIKACTKHCQRNNYSKASLLKFSETLTRMVSQLYENTENKIPQKIEPNAPQRMVWSTRDQAFISLSNPITCPIPIGRDPF